MAESVRRGKFWSWLGRDSSDARFQELNCLDGVARQTEARKDHAQQINANGDRFTVSGRLVRDQMLPVLFVFVAEAFENVGVRQQQLGKFQV